MVARHVSKGSSKGSELTDDGMTGKYGEQTKSVNTAMSTAFNYDVHRYQENSCCLPLPGNLNLLDDFHFDGASLMSFFYMYGNTRA